jgi:hypothetical protein
VARKVKVHGAAARASGRQAKAQQPDAVLGKTPLFCFNHADRATSEAWQFSPSDQESIKLLDFLCDMGCETWRDIDRMQFKGNQRHHYHPLEKITRKAKRDADRQELGEKFGDEMFRFRLGKRRRLWGFRVGRTFHVIWWDPEHKVYPGEKS